ncbi:MAG: hypothetical protein ACOX6T_06990 [Myxococcales bacterium]|jgi:hypothetical protein
MQEMAARCPKHPDQEALGVCARCGGFFCGLDRGRVGDKEYCETCAKLPEVDYLEAFRLKYWGKRDGWAWLVGASGLLYAVSGLPLLAAGALQLRISAVLFGFASLGVGALGVCFWLGFAWARVGLLAMPLVVAASNTVLVGPAAAPAALLPLLVGVAVYFDTRNRLFFKVPVAREKLQRLWHLYENNVLARIGLAVSITSLLLLPLAPVGLVLSIVGLRRVNPNAIPPVGRRGQAIAGTIIGAVSTLLAVALAVGLFLETR